MSIAPGSRLGVYEVLAPLGAGAMGEVWRARDTRLSREVALKVLPESLSRDHERLQRFEREAQVLASLNHPNIAAIYGVEEATGATALVLELVEGPTLDQRIAQGRLPADEAVTIARQIAEALEFAHERGVVHRDLKPANVKLAPDGRVKVLDFGLAKAMAADASGRSDSAISPTITSLGTVVGVVLGTAAYMAPEQARGSSVDRRADIWSFGAVLWEMLTGKRAFEGDTVSDTLASVLRAPIEWKELPPSTPRGVVWLLEGCLERDPKKRLRDIGEARIALEGDSNRFLEEDEQKTVAVPSRSPIRSIAWAAAAIVIALSAVAIVGFTRQPPPVQPVTRFQFTTDVKLASMSWPRISPDGRMVAFLGREPAGKTSIWVRPLDAFAPYQLQDTDGAARLFWSPDSRYVAYFVGRSQLKKAPVAGGPPQLICEADGGADGSWGSSGEILFDGRAVDPIRKVAASGGAATQATHPDAAKGEAGHAWPFFLPDGRHFLFLAMAKRVGEKATIHVGSLDTPGSTVVTPSDSRAEYANGYLLYVLQGTLVARRFDPDKLVASGEPIPLVEHLAVDVNDTASFSVSTNGVMAFAQGEAASTSELVWLDRSGKELGKIGAAGPYFDLALSPDGTRLAYGFAEKSGAQDIWVRDLKRDVASRLTFHPRNDIWPIWSPDGRRIAFSTDRDGHFAVMVRDASGTGSEQAVYAAEDSEVGVDDWSRDGRRLLIDLLPASRRWDIKSLPMDGAATADDYVVTDASEHGARFSPDGRYVAYVSNESGSNEVYVQTFPPSGGKWQISNGGGNQPEWRGDGKELFFVAPSDTIEAVPVSIGATFEPGIPKALFKRTLERSGIVRNRWTASSDGQRFVVNAARENAHETPFSVILNWPATLTQK
jgi:serine/threonine protein kinase/Tol biopolymer transport system component